VEFASTSSLRRKVLVLSIVPLIAICMFAAILIVNSYKQYKKAEALERSIYLSTNISAVIHELQKERGRTAGFLGSGGRESKRELQEQRILTDKKIADLKDFIDKTYLASLSEKSRDLIKNVISSDLNSIIEVRNKVDKLNISMDEAVKFYTKLNDDLIEAIGSIAKLSSKAEITRELTAYADLILAKEKMGLERAILSVAFSKDKFDLPLFERFVTLLAQQKAFIKAFELVVSSDIVKYYERTVLSSGAAKEVERLEKLALSSPFEGGFNVDPNYWFGVITNKIDLMKKVEDYISRDLLSKVEVVKVDAKRKLMMVIFFVVLSVVVVLGLRLTMLKSSEG